MGRVILNETEYKQLAAEAVSLANALLSDTGDYLGNITRLSSLRYEIGENDNDADFNIFVAISSDTDHIPYGVSRDGCSEKWLGQCDKELSDIKEIYRGHIEASCKSIIERFVKNA